MADLSGWPLDLPDHMNCLWTKLQVPTGYQGEGRAGMLSPPTQTLEGADEVSLPAAQPQNYLSLKTCLAEVTDPFTADKSNLCLALAFVASSGCLG